jgi:hypothetical protein
MFRTICILFFALTMSKGALAKTGSKSQEFAGVPFNQLNKDDQVQLIRAYITFVTVSEKTLLTGEKTAAIISFFSTAMAQGGAEANADESSEFLCTVAGWPSLTRTVPDETGTKQIYKCGHPINASDTLMKTKINFSNYKSFANNCKDSSGAIDKTLVYCNPFLFGDKAGCVPARGAGAKSTSTLCSESKTGSIDDAITYIKKNEASFAKYRAFIESEFCTTSGLAKIIPVNVKTNQKSTCDVLKARLVAIDARNAEVKEQARGKVATDSLTHAAPFCSYGVNGKTVRVYIQGGNLNLLQTAPKLERLGSYPIDPALEGRNSSGQEYKTVNTCLGPMTFAISNDGKCKPPYLEIDAEYKADGNFCSFRKNSKFRRTLALDPPIFSLTPKDGDTDGDVWWYKNLRSTTHTGEGRALEKTSSPGYMTFDACSIKDKEGVADIAPFKPKFRFNNNASGNAKCELGFDWQPISNDGAPTKQQPTGHQ